MPQHVGPNAISIPCCSLSPTFFGPPPVPQVLQSANKLFLKIRSSLTRCVKLVSRGAPLLALSDVFKKVLGMYAAELAKRLPRTAGGATTASPPYAGNEWQLKLSEEEEKVVCHILATAEFCRWGGVQLFWWPWPWLEGADLLSLAACPASPVLSLLPRPLDMVHASFAPILSSTTMHSSILSPFISTQC